MYATFSLAVVLSALIGGGQIQGLQDSSLRLQDFVDSMPVHTPVLSQRDLTGEWQLAWDDTVNAELDNEDKICTVKFREFDRSISGEFIGPVAGTERNAIIIGRISGGGTKRILSLEQRESGYVCSYQAIDSGGEIRGVWHDTRGGSGDFRLLKHQ